MQMRDVDRGWRSMRQAIARNGGRTLDVGIVGAKATQQHAGSDLTNAELGAVHEYGTSRVPERSFIRSTLAEHGAKYRRQMRHVADQVMLGRIPSLAVGMARIGEGAVDDIQHTIDQGILPELTPSTVARKGGGATTPLVDTGQMRNAITYRVTGTFGVLGGDR